MKTAIGQNNYCRYCTENNCHHCSIQATGGNIRMLDLQLKALHIKEQQTIKSTPKPHWTQRLGNPTHYKLKYHKPKTTNNGQPFPKENLTILTSVKTNYHAALTQKRETPQIKKPLQNSFSTHTSKHNCLSQQQKQNIPKEVINELLKEKQ